MLEVENYRNKLKVDTDEHGLGFTIKHALSVAEWAQDGVCGFMGRKSVRKPFAIDSTVGYYEDYTAY